MMDKMSLMRRDDATAYTLLLLLLLGGPATPYK